MRPAAPRALATGTCPGRFSDEAAEPLKRTVRYVPLNARGKPLLATSGEKDRGIGLPASFDMVREHLLDAHSIELFPSTRTVILGIPFSELRCECTEPEWHKLQADLDELEIPTTRRRWWRFW